MSPSKLHEWVLASPERARAYAQEALIVDVAEEIWAALDKAGMSKAQLAEKLGKSKAFVTQVLDGTRNMTLRTLADISFALGRRVCVRLMGNEESQVWHPLSDARVQQRPTLFALENEASLDVSSNDDNAYHTVPTAMRQLRRAA